MKKFLIIFTVIISILVSISFFINSTYFFNKYIATSIKDYGFNYTKVDGALLSGFKIDKLSYKNRELASKAELKFNPIKLLEKKISISKLRLIDVDKNTLDSVIKDFKPKDDSSSSTTISLNFEIKDILLTVKPFRIQYANIKRNILKVDYIEYINNKFNIGKVDYSAHTSLGNIEFSGKYLHRVLNIDNLELKKFNLKEFLPLLKKLQSGDDNSTIADSNMSSPIIPKIVNIKHAKLTLSPFKNKELSAKDLKVEILSGKFNVDMFKLEKAKFNIKYRSNFAKVVSSIYFNKSELNITKANIDIFNASKLETIYKKYIDNNSSNLNNGTEVQSIVSIQRVYLKKLNLHFKDYILNNEKIKSVDLLIKNAFLDTNNTKLNIDSYSSKIHTATTFISIDGSLDKNIVINKAIIKSNNIDKFITIFKSKKNKDSNKTISYKYIHIPTKYILKNLKLNGDKLSFNPLKINKTLLLAQDIIGDINNLSIDSGNLKIKVSSNWGKANLYGKIRNSNFYAKGSYKVDDNILKGYNIPLIAKNIEPLVIDGRFGFKSLDINIKLKGKNILKSAKNIDILSSNNKLTYKYKSGYLKLITEGNIKTDYTGLSTFENIVLYDNKLKYNGKLTPKNQLSFSKNLGNLFNNLSLTYSGDTYKIDLAFKTDELKGIIKSKNYSGGILRIKNIKAIKLSELTNLPKDYNGALVSKLEIEAPLNYNKILPLKGRFNASSNLINIEGTWNYDNNFQTKFISTINKKSLIAKRVPKLNINALSPMNVEIVNHNNIINCKLKNKILSGNINYSLKNTQLDTTLSTNSLKLKAKGDKNSIDFDINSNSIKRALKDISTLYKINKLAKIDGSIILKGKISKINGLKLSAKSPKIIYFNKNKSTKLENTALNLSYKNNNINISNYKFKTKGYNFYSNKLSSISINKNIVNIKKLWLNDSLLAIGNYNTSSSQGKLKLKAINLKIDKSEAQVILNINTDIKVNKDKTAISGKVEIVNGIIKTNLKNKSISQNDDIVILQRKAVKENTNFAKNIKLNLTIKSQKGIIYAQDGSYFKLMPNLKIIKNYRKLPRFRGNVNIQKGGYYILNGKKLILKKGIITFKGKSSTPYLNIVMFYHGKDYNIRINLSGTPNRPILYFTSNPPLTKDQILAYLLFDDSTAAGTHSQEAMLSLISGTIAKSFLGSIGIKIDHISIKENGFSIGKSISKNVTIYYKQDGEKASVKTRIDISKSIHTEIEVGKDTQSADIIFSKEY